MGDLDNSPEVLWWEHEPFAITYEFEGKERRYIPDFIVTFTDGRKELQEVGCSYTKEVLRFGCAKSEAGRDWARKNDASFRIVSFE